jgi:hypothetical protein
MTHRSTRRLDRLMILGSLALAVALAFPACTQQDTQTAAPEEQGTQVSANEVPAPAPEPAPAPAQPAPSRPSAPVNRPPSTTPPPAPVPQTVTYTVPESSALKVRLEQALNSGTSQVGDEFQATLVDAVIVGDRVVLPAGSTIQGTVAEVVPASKGIKESGGSMHLSFDGITTPEGNSAPMSAAFSQMAKSTAKKAGTIGGAAAGGALLGKVLGGSTKDAAIGAVVGGAIGTGVAAGTKGSELKLDAGSEMTITLTQPLSMKLKR